MTKGFTWKFEGVIWATLISSDSKQLILDIRDEQNQYISYYILDLSSNELEQLPIENSNWWSMIECYDGHLYLSEYQDQSDPNNKKYFKLAPDKQEIVFKEIPNSQAAVEEPSIFDEGSPFYNLVEEYLGFSISGPCEYLEIADKIILSYYLRLNNKLERNLRVMIDERQELSVLQDEMMKGFAPGAFFVLANRLFFVKNRNEICIYPL